jgi:hypothetical protein
MRHPPTCCRSRHRAEQGRALRLCRVAGHRPTIERSGEPGLGYGIAALDCITCGRRYAGTQLLAADITTISLAALKDANESAPWGPALAEWDLLIDTGIAAAVDQCPKVHSPKGRTAPRPSTGGVDQSFPQRCPCVQDHTSRSAALNQRGIPQYGQMLANAAGGHGQAPCQLGGRGGSLH